jgi:hypothetical protein
MHRVNQSLIGCTVCPPILILCHLGMPLGAASFDVALVCRQMYAVHSGGLMVSPLYR